MNNCYRSNTVNGRTQRAPSEIYRISNVFICNISWLQSKSTLPSHIFSETIWHFTALACACVCVCANAEWGMAEINHLHISNQMINYSWLYIRVFAGVMLQCIFTLKLLAFETHDRFCRMRHDHTNEKALNECRLYSLLIPVIFMNRKSHNDDSPLSSCFTRYTLSSRCYWIENREQENSIKIFPIVFRISINIFYNTNAQQR